MSGRSEDPFLVGQYTDLEWEAITELGEHLGIADQLRRESPRANRDLILDKLGYSASWGIDNGMMGLLQAWFTTCRKCGCPVPLRDAEQGHLAPLDQHNAFHARLGQ